MKSIFLGFLFATPKKHAYFRLHDNNVGEQQHFSIKSLGV